MTICVPPDTDWSCSYTAEQLEEMRADPVVAANMEKAEALAWMTLAALTADQVGTCPITVRPCKAGCPPAGSYLVAPVDATGRFAGVLPGRAAFTPFVNASGAWVNSCGCASGDCSCTALCEAIIPGPVGDIVEVWLNGGVLDPSSYRVDNGDRLVRTDGECWPLCQDMAQDAHGDEAFSVTYYRGMPPNAVSLWMAGLLAVEWYKACISDKSCRLPAGTQQVTRQGVNYTIGADMFDGTTGIREVDAFVNRLNPYGLKSAPVIAIPNARPARQTTWAR